MAAENKASKEASKEASKAGTKMHQTTLRFGTELWAELEQEAKAAGVSVAQYVREAALIRISYDAGRRGDWQFQAALDDATLAPEIRQARAAVRRYDEQRDSVVALREQGRLARKHAEQLRDRAKDLRDRPQPS
jgi:hypothetical protein